MKGREEEEEMKGREEGINISISQITVKMK